ncbi:desulfoferrodoxin [archaeon]|nr:desulfoferrodoxin [archaeon]|tara:strand:+ start:491 stop:865 length:375 start_codon:yes stop_codon:yes gene_type:complete
MTELNEVYKCKTCGNMIEVIHAATPQLICCEIPMILQKENTTDAAQEKHVPVIEKIENGFNVKVGSVEHPMEEEHHIEWIEAIADGKIYRKHLKPGDKPQAEFCIKAEKVQARAYCNLHGLWKA